MKTYRGIFTIILFAIVQISPGLSQQLFHDTYDVPNYWESSMSMARLSNDDLVMIGESSNSTFSQDFYNYLHRTDANGNTILQLYYQEVNANFLCSKTLKLANMVISL